MWNLTWMIQEHSLIHSRACFMVFTCSHFVLPGEKQLLKSSLKLSYRALNDMGHFHVTERPAKYSLSPYFCYTCRTNIFCTPFLKDDSSYSKLKSTKLLLQMFPIFYRLPGKKSINIYGLCSILTSHIPTTCTYVLLTNQKIITVNSHNNYVKQYHTADK